MDFSVMLSQFEEYRKRTHTERYKRVSPLPLRMDERRSVQRRFRSPRLDRAVIIPNLRRVGNFPRFPDEAVLLI